MNKARRKEIDKAAELIAQAQEIVTILNTVLAKSEALEDEIIARVKGKGLKDILIHRNLGVRLQIQQAIEGTKASGLSIWMTD